MGNEKYVIFAHRDKDTKKLNSYRTVKTIEEEITDLGKFKPFRIFWLLLFNKKFRSLFRDTLFYAFRHHDSYRGTGSAEVFLFKDCYYCYKIFKEKSNKCKRRK